MQVKSSAQAIRSNPSWTVNSIQALPAAPWLTMSSLRRPDPPLAPQHAPAQRPRDASAGASDSSVRDGGTRAAARAVSDDRFSRRGSGSGAEPATPRRQGARQPRRPPRPKRRGSRHSPIEHLDALQALDLAAELRQRVHTLPRQLRGPCVMHYASAWKWLDLLNTATAAARPSPKSGAARRADRAAALAHLGEPMKRWTRSATPHGGRLSPKSRSNHDSGPILRPPLNCAPETRRHSLPTCAEHVRELPPAHLAAPASTCACFWTTKMHAAAYPRREQNGPRRGAWSDYPGSPARAHGGAHQALRWCTSGHRE